MYLFSGISSECLGERGGCLMRTMTWSSSTHSPYHPSSELGSTRNSKVRNVPHICLWGVASTSEWVGVGGKETSVWKMIHYRRQPKYNFAPRCFNCAPLLKKSFTPVAKDVTINWLSRTPNRDCRCYLTGACWKHWEYFPFPWPNAHVCFVSTSASYCHRSFFTPA